MDKDRWADLPRFYDERGPTEALREFQREMGLVTPAARDLGYYDMEDGAADERAVRSCPDCMAEPAVPCPAHLAERADNR
jgi:hypothetical protein